MGKVKSWVSFRKKAPFFMKGSSERQDYHKYPWKLGEWVWVLILCFGEVGALAYFFYRSAWALIPLSAVGVWIYRSIAAHKAKTRREKLAAQFRECILCVSASLQAGYSVENAFVECMQDMVMMYGAEAMICRELLHIRRGLNINISLEELLLDFGERSCCEDIQQFARIFAQAKRSGGNLSEMIRSCAGQIGKQIELRQEINTLLSARKMELNIMKLIPFGILVYVDLGSPGYFDSLYCNLQGGMLMSICLGVYLGANWLGEKIFEDIVAQLV